jgi:hypothetical protein
MRRTIGLLVTLALGLLVVPLAAGAPPGKMPRIGVLALGPPPVSPNWKAHSPFVQELRMFGWTEGQIIIPEYRWAEGQASRLSPLAAELVRLPVHDPEGHLQDHGRQSKTARRWSRHSGSIWNFPAPPAGAWRSSHSVHGDSHPYQGHCDIAYLWLKHSAESPLCHARKPHPMVFF